MAIEDDNVLDHPERWCLSHQQLLEIEQTAQRHFGNRYPRQTMRDICREIIVPRCNQMGKSYALSLNPNGLEIGVFVSHCWSGYFADFCRSIRRAFQAKSRKPNLWICAFSLRQSSEAQVMRNQLQSDTLEETPFARAIARAPLFVCVRNSQTDLYSRIWCVCELFCAKQSGLFPDRAFVDGPDCFKDLQTSCVDAHATNKEDKLLILKALLRNDGDAERVDEIIQEFRSHHSPDGDNPMSSTPPHRSQEELVRQYRRILKKRGKLCRKKAASFIRKATKGEFITTTVLGIKETDNLVTDDSSWVVCGGAGEFYILTQNQLEENYDASNPKEIKAESSGISPTLARHLHEGGYREFRSKRKAWAYQVDQLDLEWFLCRKNDSFAQAEAPWGSLMRIEPGDYLLTQYPLANDGIYRVERGVFEDTYEEDDELQRSRWDERGNAAMVVWGTSLLVAIIATVAACWNPSHRRSPPR